MFLSAAIGTAFAFFLPFIKVLTLLYKAAAALCMLSVFKNKNKKTYFLRIAVFVGYSFFLGGIISGLFNLKSGAIAGAITYDDDIFFFTLIGCLIFFLIIRKLYLTVMENKRKRYYYKIKLKVGDYLEEITGYYDSGNKLYDVNDNTPAVILSKDIAEKIIKVQKLEFFELAINTVSGKNKLKAFKIDRLWIYSEKDVNIIDNITAAVADGSFGGFKILLHNEML
jgi:hypothetical protein